MAAPAGRELREELESLRIGRPAPKPGGGGGPRRLLWAGGAAALLLVVGLGGWLLFGGAPAVSVAYASAQTAGGAGAATPVLSGSGYVVTGDKYISLGVRVPGRIEAYYVDESQHVKAGQPLVQLDARSFKAALSRIEAGLVRARATAELRKKELVRLRALATRDFASDAEVDVKEMEVRVADAQIGELEAQLDSARTDLDDTVLRAPTDGIILAKLKEVGEIAVPGGFEGSGELIRMANLHDLRAEVDVSEADLSRVRMGARAQVVPDAYADRRYDAKVVKLYPQVNRQKGTLKVEVKITEPDEWLLPDMSVRVHFLSDETSATPGAPVVRIPRAALRSDGSGSYVWVVTQDRLRRQPVRAASSEGDPAVVLEGLLGGEAVVTGDTADLAEGDRVEIASAADGR
jgi:RND family efflux transporter MFP subunit